MNQLEEASQPASALPPPRRRRLRYLIPRFDSTIVLRAELPRLAGRGAAPAARVCRPCSPQEVRPRLENLPGNERKSGLRRLADAGLVVYHEVDGELAFWEFVQLAWAELPPDVSRPADEDRLAYIFGAFTRAPCRGHGLFSGGLEWLIDWLAERGYTHLYSQTAAENVVSLLAHLTSGFEALGESRHLHWGGRRRVWATRRLPRPVAADCGAQPDLSTLSPRAYESLRRALLCPR